MAGVSKEKAVSKSGIQLPIFVKTPSSPNQYSLVKILGNSTPAKNSEIAVSAVSAAALRSSHKGAMFSFQKSFMP